MSSEPVPPDNADAGNEDVRASDLRHLFGFFAPAARPHRRLLFWLALCLFVEVVLNFSWPLAGRYLVDEGLIHRDHTVVVNVLVFLGVAAVTVSVVGFVADYLNAAIVTVVVGGIRTRLFDHVQGLSLPFFTRTNSGSVLSRFSGDLVALEGALTTVVPRLIVPALEVLYCVVLLFLFNVQLALLALMVFPFLLVLPRQIARLAFDLNFQKRQREGELLGAVHQTVGSQPVVLAFGLQEWFRAAFGGLSAGWAKVAFRSTFLSHLVERSSHMGVYILHVVLFGIGAYWAFTGRITIGTLVAFEATFLAMGYAVTQVAQFIPTLAQAVGSARHLDELFAQRPEIVDAPDPVTLPPLRREIAFEGVSFRYPDGAFELRGVDLRIGRHAFVALVGGSGSGKSTLLSLLLRLYDPTRGAIRIDGVDLRAATQESIRAQLGVVYQDSVLFDASIGENIRLGLPGATDEQVEAAARSAELHDWIVSQPAGYQTPVGERGGLLSGGQRQRVAVARALVRNPAILLLDEATSSLDAATEAALNATLRKIAATRTVVSVVHRLDTLAGTDQVVVFADGVVLEQGTRDELLRGGAFAALYQQQRRSENEAE